VRQPTSLLRRLWDHYEADRPPCERLGESGEDILSEHSYAVSAALSRSQSEEEEAGAVSGSRHRRHHHHQQQQLHLPIPTVEQGANHDGERSHYEVPELIYMVQRTCGKSQIDRNQIQNAARVLHSSKVIFFGHLEKLINYVHPGSACQVYCDTGPNTVLDAYFIIKGSITNIIKSLH
jgi:hypothetical protein